MVQNRFLKMKYLNTYNESIRDLLKPKSDEEIISIIDNLEPYKKLKMAKKYNYQLSDEEDIIKNALKSHPNSIIYALKYDYDDLSKIVSDYKIKKALEERLNNLFGLMKYNKREGALDELKKTIFYLFKKGYIYDNVDSLGDLWFKHKTFDAYSGGHIHHNGYSTLGDAIEYVTRMEKLREEGK